MATLSPGSRVSVVQGSWAGRNGTVVQQLDMLPEFDHLDPGGAYDVALDGEGAEVHPIQRSWLTPISDGR